MKKVSLLLVLFIFGCQSLTPKTTTSEKKIIEPSKLREEHQTHDQFESKDLKIFNKDKKKIQVALFLPFSGKNKELGWHLFNSATISLFENDLNHNIELVLVDSKDTPEENKKAFREIVDKKIKIVIGPIFSSSIEAIEKDIKDNGITAISFSNNQDLIGKTDDNGGIFLAGMLPEAQIDKIVSYSMERGKISFSVIAPNNKYGIATANLVKKFVKNRDGNFIISEFYDPSGKDLDKVVERAINSFILPSWLLEQNGSKTKKNPTIISESDRIYPQVIMIPESGKNLSKIVNLIKQKNKEERDFQFIGTSQWDDVSTLSDYNLSGSWFAAPENYKFRNFEKSYHQTYNQIPPRISSIAYDSISIISELIDYKKGQIPTIGDFTSYANPPKNGFEGIDGLLRFLPNGLVQRNLAVLEVGNGQFDTIEKPVEKFLRY